MYLSSGMHRGGRADLGRVTWSRDGRGAGAPDDLRLGHLTQEWLARLAGTRLD